MPHYKTYKKTIPSFGVGDLRVRRADTDIELRSVELDFRVCPLVEVVVMGFLGYVRWGL